MGKGHFDAILASVPLNGTAGRVVAKGVHYISAAPVTERRWEAPPALARITRKERQNSSFVDFTGQRIGRITVLGMAAGEGHEARGAMWVCRCACGNYIGRRAKALRKALPDTACQDCERTAILRKGGSSEFARHRAESEKAKKW